MIRKTKKNDMIMGLIDTLKKNIIVTGVVSAVLATGIVGAAGIVINKIANPKVDISEGWTVYVTTDNTAYKPYKNLTSVWEFLITQKGDKAFVGSGEKMRDVNPDGSITSYEATRRDGVKFNGIIKKAFGSNAQIQFECRNYGLLHESTAIYNVEMINDDSLSGTFTTTVAHGSGRVIMKHHK